jgi:hypothetical protein
MKKNLFSYLNNMKRLFNNDILGDDSICEYSFIKKKTYHKKKKLYLYYWTL